MPNIVIQYRGIHVAIGVFRVPIGSFAWNKPVLQMKKNPKQAGAELRQAQQNWPLATAANCSLLSAV